jgi:hypothetical protein
MRKIFLILTVFLLAFAVFGSANSTYAFNNSHWFHVDVLPSNAGVQAGYHIYGGVSDYDGIDSMVLYLQWTGHKYEHPSPSAITVNGSTVASVFMESVPDRNTSRNNLKITLALKSKINKGDSIDIKIDKSAGIINPSEPRPCYQVSVYLIRNSVQKGYIGSEQYAITQSAVSTPIVKVDPAIKGMNAEYSISFVTGVNGNLHKGDDIRIKFPQGTVIPANPFSQYVYINGKKVSSGVYRDNNDPNILRVFISNDIDVSTPVTVLIKKGMGIINPPVQGEYKLSVSTYMEPDWVESNSYKIASPAVQNLTVKLNSDVVTNSASINIHFETSPVGFLSKGAHVYVDFPKEFSLPSGIDSSLVVFNGVNAEAEINGNRLVISAPVQVLNSSDVDIKISDKAQIKNPPVAGDYDIYVSTENDDVPSKYTVNIKPSIVSGVTFNSLYTGVGITSEYTISFKTGPAGNLANGIDFIKINFGNEFSLPEEGNASDITINNVPLNNVSLDACSVIATVPVDISSNSIVDVKISEDFGIKNPAQVGEYSVMVSTSKETTEVKSSAVNFTVLPVVNFTVIPGEPDGDNGFYRTRPLVQLSSPNGKEIYYKLDDGEFAPYLQGLLIPDGEHTLFAYAVDSNGNKGDPEEKKFKVDDTPPSISFDQASGDIYVNTVHPTLTGKVSEPCVLQINGVPAVVNKDLTFNVKLSVTDNAPLAIYARDLAGNSVSIVRTVHVDDTPPVITLISPDKLQSSTTESNFVIQLKLNEEGSAELNGEEMDFSGGVFSKAVNLSKGENNFNIVAYDTAGNESSKLLKIELIDEITIKLTIGSDTAYVGDKAVPLDSPPIIENSTTLIPLRFVLETFGANLKWDGTLKVIAITTNSHTVQLQIGSKIALIDNTEVKKLLVAPVIRNNRTLVPLRFLAETFGADVGWDSSTKTITITYTP